MVKLGKYDAEVVEYCPICRTVGEFIVKATTDNKDINFDVYICPKCNCSYNSPRMTPEAMTEYYSSGDYITRTLEKRNGRGNFGERRRALRMMAMLMWLPFKKVPSPTRALDVGCSQGHFLERMRDLWIDLETVGYDIYKDPDAVHEVVTDKDEITGEFDFISCIHVLEHIYDPIAELKWMESLLSKGGFLLLEVPTMRHIILEHPITFSLDTIPVAMEQIGIKDYSVIELPESYASCLVVAKK